MKIGMIQASSQRDKNGMLEACMKTAVCGEHEIINFGIFETDKRSLTYLQAALCISLLLESGAIDFIVTGCSSGQGMMLACNSLPGILCGYVENVADAFLFGRINNGNAVSYPLGLNWGWTGEINFMETIRALFCEPLGTGYPPQEAERKKRDAKQLKKMNAVCKKTLSDVLPLLDREDLSAALGYDVVYQYIMKNAKNKELMEIIRKYRDML